MNCCNLQWRQSKLLDINWTTDPHRPHVLIQLHPSAVGFGCLFCSVFCELGRDCVQQCFAHSFFCLSHSLVSQHGGNLVICSPKGCTEDSTGSGKLVGAACYIEMRDRNKSSTAWDLGKMRLIHIYDWDHSFWSTYFFRAHIHRHLLSRLQNMIYHVCMLKVKTIVWGQRSEPW